MTKVPAHVRIAMALFAVATSGGATRVGAQEWPLLQFIDATYTHLPLAPDLHAMDAAAIDVDRDGDLDLAIAVENGANRLYLNDGTGHFTFTPGAFGSAVHDSEHV